MNFNSPSYLLFLPTVLVAYLAVRRSEILRDIVLLIASYAFYMSWNWKYSGLIIFSTVIDYAVGIFLSRSENENVRRFLLMVSLITNLGLLAAFKYFNFFLNVTEDTLHFFGSGVSWSMVDVLLPVGISFYTFQTMSYTIDLYRREIKHEHNFIKFALFVSFFPQLVAGPIVRAKEFLPQLHRSPSVDARKFNSGLMLVFQGLFKKIVIADLLAALAVDDVFGRPQAYSSWDLYIALCGYAYQIYNDFSGYSDIAIGTGRMLGFELPVNFNRPYLAEGIREFWSRWHISLSTWLRDYLYIPLGGNRRGNRRTYINLFLTMLLGGLWHGAAMNFVLWGMYHGALLMIAHALGRRDSERGFRWWRRIGCFHLVLFGWLLFRVDSLATFNLVVNGLLQLSTGTRLNPLYYAILVCAILLHFSPTPSATTIRNRMAELPAPILGGISAILLLLFWGCTLGTPSFIYFQF